ncbi:MAG TPA: hypothetical protein VJ777_07895 [Mycobacterium sp.]|nr:hypothetical protein [Mycobacterium sp.]
MLIRLLVLLCVLLPLEVSAQVALDTSTEQQSSNAGSVTWSHTISGSDRFLLVGCTNSDTLTWSATYNSVSMGTPIINADPNRPLVLWGLVAPATGANNIVVSWTDGNREPYCIASSYTGVDQSTPYDTPPAPTDAGGTSTSLNVTSATNDMVVDYAVMSVGVTTLTVTAGGQTELQQQVGNAAPGNAMGSSYKAGATTTTMSWSWSGFSSYNQWGINLNAAGAPPASTCTGGMLTMGAGIKCHERELR